MNILERILDILNSSINIVISYFWLILIAVAYTGIEMKRATQGKPYYIVVLYRKFKEWGDKQDAKRENIEEEEDE